MRNLLIVFGLSVILAYASQYYGYNYMLEAGEKKKVNVFIVAMVVLMILFVGLRTGYNDSLLSSKSQNNCAEIGT